MAGAAIPPLHLGQRRDPRRRSSLSDPARIVDATREAMRDPTGPHRIVTASVVALQKSANSEVDDPPAAQWLIRVFLALWCWPRKAPPPNARCYSGS
jgi:hypothetical protein